MKFLKLFFGRRQYTLPIFAQQASYLIQASDALLKMSETLDESSWRILEKEVKMCEVQGDALLTEVQEQLYESIMGPMRRTDMQSIAMSLDDFLDHINDSAKSILLYLPGRIDVQLKDLCQYISAEADAIKQIMACLGAPKMNIQFILKQCDRITELEHASDDSYEEYIASLFSTEKNAIELMKYKNIAEMLEATTDSAKRVSDNVRKVLIRYID